MQQSNISKAASQMAKQRWQKASKRYKTAYFKQLSKAGLEKRWGKRLSTEELDKV